MDLGTFHLVKTHLARVGSTPYNPLHSAREGGFRRVFLRPRPVFGEAQRAKPDYSSR